MNVLHSSVVTFLSEDLTNELELKSAGEFTVLRHYGLH